MANYELVTEDSPPPHNPESAASPKGQVRVLRWSFYRHQLKYAIMTASAVIALVLVGLLYSSRYTPNEISSLNVKRREAVKMSMQHAWNEYYDMRSIDGGLSKVWKKRKGHEILGLLDTLHIMDLEEQYQVARKEALSFDFDKWTGKINFFSTSTSALGGLLSTYELTEDVGILEKAKELGEILLLAFNGSKTDLPYADIYTSSKSAEPKSHLSISELGKYQLEFQKLSQLSGNPVYKEKAQLAVDILDKAKKPAPGMYPPKIDYETKELSGRISLGSAGIGWYESIFKQHILNGKSNEQYGRMFSDSLSAMKEKMVVRAFNDKEKSFVASDANATTGEVAPVFRAESASIPGLLALDSKESDNQEGLVLAKSMVKLVYSLYEKSPTGLAPHIVLFPTKKGMSGLEAKHQMHKAGIENYDHPLVYNKQLGCFVLSTRHEPDHKLLESLLYMYRATEDRKYQDWAWEIFSAIDDYLDTRYGYYSYEDVLDTSKEDMLGWPANINTVAAIFKYLYLIFGPSDALPLGEYVFNAEAHPFKVIK